MSSNIASRKMNNPYRKILPQINNLDSEGSPKIDPVIEDLSSSESESSSTYLTERCTSPPPLYTPSEPSNSHSKSCFIFLLIVSLSLSLLAIYFSNPSAPSSPLILYQLEKKFKSFERTITNSLRFTETITIQLQEIEDSQKELFSQQNEKITEIKDNFEQKSLTIEKLEQFSLNTSKAMSNLLNFSTSIAESTNFLKNSLFLIDSRLVKNEDQVFNLTIRQENHEMRLNSLEESLRQLSESVIPLTTFKYEGDILLAEKGAKIKKHSLSLGDNLWRKVLNKPKYRQSDPNLALNPDISQSNCWAFSGKEGYLIAALGEPSSVSKVGVTIPSNAKSRLQAVRVTAFDIMSNELDSTTISLKEGFNEMLLESKKPVAYLAFRFWTSDNANAGCVYKISAWS